MPVIGDPDRRLGFAREIDRRNGLHAERALGAKAAADVIGDDADLVMAELVALGDQLHDVKHRLRRGVHGQPVAVEARDGGMRLQAGMRLRAGAECPLDQPRILLRRARPRPSSAPSWPSAKTPRMVRGHCRSRRPARACLPRRCRLSCGWIFRTPRANRVCARRPVRSPTAARSLVILMAAMAAIGGLAVLCRNGGDGIADISAPCGRRRAARPPR